MRDRDCIYLEILRWSRRRSDRARLRADRVSETIEASHMALIPALLRCTDERRHRHYLEVEIPRYIRGFQRGGVSEFEPLWAELEALIPPPAPIPFAATDGRLVLSYFSPSTRK